MLNQLAFLNELWPNENQIFMKHILKEHTSCATWNYVDDSNKIKPPVCQPTELHLFSD